MNGEIKKFISNFSLTLLANIVTTLVSATVILIVPAYIDIMEYGYWQLFIFFCSYTAYFSVGLTDGIYIRNGGKKYRDLDTNIIRPQFWILLFLNALVTIPITLTFIFIYQDFNKVAAVFFACLSAIIIIPRSLLTMVMLTTNRIKENAVVIIADRGIYLITVIICLILGFRNFFFIIFADLLGQITSTCIASIYCKELVFGNIKKNLKTALIDAKINIQIGLKIVLASLASILVIGVIRFGIEGQWGVEVFARVSLTLSLCNLLLMFIKSISVVIFPTLCNLSFASLQKYYIHIQNILAVLILGALILYYPIKLLLSQWLPQYAESLKYMALLFPISLFESKTQLLLNTYFKVLRKEKKMLQINILTVCCSFITILIATLLANSIDLAILSIVVVLGIRTFLSEIYLTSVLEINMRKDIVLECVSCILFIIFSWFLAGLAGMCLYSIWYIIFLYFKKDYILEIVQSLYKKKMGEDK